MYMHYESNKLDYYKSIKLNRIDSDSKILKDMNVIINSPYSKNRLFSSGDPISIDKIL